MEHDARKYRLDGLPAKQQVINFWERALWQTVWLKEISFFISCLCVAKSKE